MPSRIFHYLSSFRSSHRGGAGHVNPSKVLRVNESVLQDLDVLIESWRYRANHTTSPRYDKLKEFLSELEEILPAVPESQEIPF